jgi:hypothetical protein
MTIAILVVVLVVGLGLVVVYGASRWEAGTRELRTRLEEARVPVHPQVVDLKEIEGLPGPVQRYFRRVIKDGGPMVSRVRVQHRGTFNMGDTSDRWRPFTSHQLMITRRPGFDWDARISMMPGLTVRVHDAYVAGEGILHASLLGLITVASLRGTPDAAEGELMRFFAEAAWYPTALLPGQNVHWEAVDEQSARATLVDGAIAITMMFSFNEEGVIETVRADARGRTVGDEIIPTPWQGRFWNYHERSGMYVPLEGEVSWLLPEGPKSYWRGQITSIGYEFAE